MKKTTILTSILLIGVTSLLAENITQKQADEIVLNYVQSEAKHPYSLYAGVNDPNEITTSNGETFRVKYACWAYCLDENEPAQRRRYLFIKKDDGNLLEIIANNDESVLAWMAMDMPTGLTGSGSSVKLLYPNPVGDMLTLPCNGDQDRVEIYDLKGTCLFSGLISDSCLLNVSFLNTGVYMVNVSGEMYKIIKK